MSLEVAISMNMPAYIALQSTAGPFAPDDDLIFLFLLGPQVFFLFDVSFEQVEKQSVLIVSYRCCGRRQFYIIPRFVTENCLRG